MMKGIGKLLAAVALSAVLLGAGAYASPEEQTGLIQNFNPEDYDVRNDYTGELGYLFEPSADLLVTSVSVPWFEGNINTKLFIYEVVKKPALDTHIAPDEVAVVASCEMDHGSENVQDGNIVAELSSPVELKAGKEYIVSYITGQLDGYDCMSFYNSGPGQQTKALETDQNVKILSCTFAQNMTEGGKNLQSDGAHFALNRAVPGTGFGMPDLFYTATPAAETVKETQTTAQTSGVISQDDFEEVVIPSPETNETVKSHENDGNANIYTILLAEAVLVISVLIVMVIAVIIVIRKSNRKR